MLTPAGHAVTAHADDIGNWREADIGSVVEHKKGFAFKSSDYESFGHPIVRVSNLTDRSVDMSGCNFIAPEVVSTYESVSLLEGDIVVATVGSGPQNPGSLVGRAIRVPREAEGALLNQNTVRLRSNGLVHQEFLFHCLRLPEFQQYLVAGSQGSANQASITLKQIFDFRIPLPPRSEQKAIAGILGALDEKIELNRRMNETLEAMARAIFKSWFVDFDPVRAKLDGRQSPGMDADTAALFPDHFEHVDGESVPKGWAFVPLPEAVDVNPKRTLKKGSKVPYLDMNNMPTAGHRPDEWVDRQFNSGTKFIDGDTLLARITPCLENGKTAFVDFLTRGQVGWGSTEYIVLRPKPPLPAEFGYYLARSEELRLHAIQNMTGTSGRQRVPPSCFDRYRLAVPPPAIAARFGEVIRTLMERISANCEQSKSLGATRDALLPKLLSGELRVADGENFVGDLT